ncbi:MAG TPA: FAD-dependent thymidylate synthase, partial [Longimicrobiales bacterium]|nr:FAD-dependent thymidylate synthase [Longimicrobiales bacterium]
ARSFYTRWLAEYGDDSIAQMTGVHLCFPALSQIAIKHFERMRVGLAPIEQSTRYVEFGDRVGGRYRYVTDPMLADLGLEGAYESAMDGVFSYYGEAVRGYVEELTEAYPDESNLARRTKAFDVFREVLPMATTGQVAFFGSGQALEYLLARSLDHRLAEVRHAAALARAELEKVIPSLLARLGTEQAADYRRYLAGREEAVERSLRGTALGEAAPAERRLGVRLVDHDPEGEEKVLAALAYAVLDQPLEEVRARVREMSHEERRTLLAAALEGRRARWYKVPRAFEQAQLTFEVTLTIGAWRDLQRHRMHTQYRARLSPSAEYHVPEEIRGTRWEAGFREAVERLSEVGERVAAHDRALAEYCCSFSHLMRFVQHQNLRAAFWEIELRTGSQGHPIYRRIELEKAKLVREVYPTLGAYLLADAADYPFARRGQEQRAAAKHARLTGGAAP